MWKCCQNRFCNGVEVGVKSCVGTGDVRDDIGPGIVNLTVAHFDVGIGSGNGAGNDIGSGDGIVDGTWM